MTRKLLLSAILVALSVLASAQYKVSAIDHQYVPAYELKYILEGENSTFIYGTFTTPRAVSMYFDRATAVYQNDMKYKIKNSVNIPVWDDADKMSAQFQEEGQKLNFVAEFEKFSAAEVFDIVENPNPKENSIYMNIYGVQTDSLALEKFPDFDRFLDAYPLTLYGSYIDNGSHFNYYMHEGIYVSCQCTQCEGGLFEPDYVRFLVEISNDSDHGVSFDFDKVYVFSTRDVRGKTKEKYFTKYTPDSFEEYMAEEDYYEAKAAVGSDMDRASYLLKQESYRTSNEWGKLGFQVLSNIAKESAEQSIQEYLATHPKQRPGVLRSQSLKSGQTISGYIAFKYEKADMFTIHIPIDGFDYFFKWK